MKADWRKFEVARPAWGGAPLTLSGLRESLVAALGSPTVQVEVLLVVAVTVLAALVRVLQLTDIPPGLHGDEGLAGLDGQRILREGWIGPYLPSALGTPSGTFYWTAAVFGMFGKSMFTVRLSFAILGIATVPLTYGAFRIMFDRRVALIAAIILAVMSWHVHLSRAAFTPVSWPFMQMGALLFLVAGFQTRRWPFFAVAGLFFGGGSYGYLGYPAFMVVLGIYLAWLLFYSYRHRLQEFMRYMAVFAAFAVLIALPLITFAKSPDSAFWDRFRIYSYTKSAEYQEADGFFDKVDLFAGKAKGYFRGFVDKPTFDGVDALGINPILDRVSPFLMVAGIVLAFRNWRKPQYLLPLLMLLVVPNAALWSLDGMYRRTIGLAPFMALLVALPLALAWQTADRWRPWAKYGAYYAIAGSIALISYLNLNTYFDSYSSEPGAKWVFVHELTEASEYLMELDPKPYVYFYSGRWSFNYETRQFLAPDYPGEDRSREFGRQVLDLTPDRSREVLYLFLPPYQDLVQEVAQQFPGGTETYLQDGDGQILFRSYLLPSAASMQQPLSSVP